MSPVVASRSRRFRRLAAFGIGLGMLVLPGGCDLFTANCSGARGLAQEHQEVLECAGWLDFVISNVASVEYLDVESYISSGTDAVGSARCRKCEVTAATQAHSRFDIAKTIVHEAGHLEDGCANGEYPAILRGAQFEVDYRERGCGAASAK